MGKTRKWNKADYAVVNIVYPRELRDQKNVTPSGFTSNRSLSYYKNISPSGLNIRIVGANPARGETIIVKYRYERR